MRLEFTRDDLVIRIEKDTITFVSGKLVDQIAITTPENLVRALQKSRVVHSWSKRLPKAHYELIYRICLDIRDRDQQRVNWELAVFQFVRRLQTRPLARPPIIIMRMSPVRARSANIPFTLPLRFIEVNAGREHVRSALQQVFRSKPLERYKSALQTVSVDRDEWDHLDLPHGWPTVEVLHFGKLPPFPAGQMLSGDAATPGTLGWLVAKLITWQVRLLVISCNRAELDQMRVFASAVLARGGPAVLVEAFGTVQRRTFYNRFYEQLIHDFPLDAAWQAAFVSPPTTRFDASLFGGGGREDQLRSSNIAKKLAKFGAPRNQSQRRVTLDQTFVKKIPIAQRREVRNILDQGVKQIHAEWKTSRFEFRERQGLLPLSKVLTSMRTSLTGPVHTSLLHRSTTKSRFVNCSFWEEDATYGLTQIDQSTGQFKQNQLYQFGIQIGPKSLTVFTVNEIALVEEVFKWTPDLPGVWIEIGLSGIDFEVVGDPVQRVWLPAPGHGPTDTVYFSVIPQKSGVNRLRFVIYYEQNVIQSFRVGLVTGNKIKNKRSALAKSLEIGSRSSADVSFLPVLEFSLAPSIDNFAANPTHTKRTVAIVANNLNGDSVVTVKNASSFGVSTPGFLSGEVSKLQKELLAISNLDQAVPNYPFNLQNEGTQAGLESTLRTLADRGAALFQMLIDSNAWADIRTALEPADQTIQVAQILRLHVIPWSFLYTRELDPRPGDRDATGKLTNMPVCLAALPDAKGELPVKSCGTSKNCVLHQNSALKPEHVVCPLQFWGFKHVIEIPPKQIDTKAKTATAAAARPSAVQTAIKVKGDARVVAGVNSSLGYESSHFTNLGTLKTRYPLATFKQQYTFADLRAELAKSPFHIAYFFCHAEGGVNVNTQIILQAALGVPEPVLAYQFGNLFKGQKWNPPALVFLNACRSNNYSPEALSPFLGTFVDTLGASGLIGTEVDVWDIFAAEVGKLFLENFLNGEYAGMSLLKARRVLLAKNNPLGLVYTLFASADLHLE